MGASIVTASRFNTGNYRPPIVKMNFVRKVVHAFTVVNPVIEQLPNSNESLTCAQDRKAVRATIMPALNGKHNLMPLVEVGYRNSLPKRITVCDNRTARVDDQFNLRELAVRPGNHRFRILFVRYASPWGQLLKPYAFDYVLTNHLFFTSRVLVDYRYQFESL